MELLIHVVAPAGDSTGASFWESVGVPLVVALLGMLGIIFTQWRADRRQDKANLDMYEQQRRIAITAQQRDAAAELISAVWELARVAVDVLPDDGGDWTDLEPGEVVRLEEAQARMYVLADERLEAATDTLIESLRAFVGNRDQKNWDAIAVAQFIEVLNMDEPLLSRHNKERIPVA